MINALELRPVIDPGIRVPEIPSVSKILSTKSQLFNDILCLLEYACANFALSTAFHAFELWGPPKRGGQRVVVPGYCCCMPLLPMAVYTLA